MVRIPDPSPRRSFGFRDTLQGFLLNGDLAFAQLLERDLVQQVFARHGAFFGGVFHTAIVLWAFMSQVLRDCTVPFIRATHIPTAKSTHIPAVAQYGHGLGLLQKGLTRVTLDQLDPEYR